MVEIIGRNSGREHTVQWVRAGPGSECSLFSERQFHSYESTTEFSVSPKGQSISKCLFGFFNFSQKTKKNKSTWGIIVVKSNFFCSVFGRIEDTKKSFWNKLTFRSYRWLFLWICKLQFDSSLQFFFSFTSSKHLPIFLSAWANENFEYMRCRVDEIKFYYNCISETFSLKSQFSIKHSHSVFGSV